MGKTLIVLNDTTLLTTFKIRMHSYTSNSQNVILAQSSLEAIDILKENTVTLLVTDLSASRLDSFEMLIYVAKQHHQMRVVVVSDLATSNLESSATIHCINKPKSQRDLGLLTETVAPGAQLKTAGNMLVRDFFQLIEAVEETCLLEIGSSKTKGLVYFNQGVLFDGFCAQYKGEQTILNMLDKKCTEISFRKLPDKAIRRKITTPLARLIDKGTDFKVEPPAIAKVRPVDSKIHAEKVRTVGLLKNKLKQMKAVDEAVKKDGVGSLDQTGTSVVINTEEIEINKTQTVGKNDMSLFGLFKGKETDSVDKSVKKRNNSSVTEIDVSLVEEITEEKVDTTQTIGKNILLALEENLQPLQDIDGYLAATIFDMGGEVLVQHSNSKYNVSLIGTNAITMISAAVNAMIDAGLGKCNFIQVNSEQGVFGAVWAVESQSVVAVLLEPNANLGMAKLMLAKAGKTSGSQLA